MTLTLYFSNLLTYVPIKYFSGQGMHRTKQPTYNYMTNYPKDRTTTFLIELNKLRNTTLKRKISKKK